MPLSVTVKTLDSRNHEVGDIPDAILVKDFKELIAERVGIAAASQRLIYCGRVLQDDKTLAEYQVDGKVVHLVQRAPSTSQGPDRLAAPEARARSRGPSPGRGAAAGGHRQHIHFVAPMGAARPILSSAVGETSPRVRLNLAKRMLANAKIVVDRLDNPNAPPPSPPRPAAAAASASSSSTTTSSAASPPSPTIQISATATGPNGQPLPANVTQALSGLLMQPMMQGAMAVGAAGESQTMSFRVGHDGQVHPLTPAEAQQMDGNAAIRIEGEVHPARGTAAAAASSSASGSPTGPAAAAGGRGAGATPPRPQQLEYPPTRDMAAVMTEYDEINDRLRTHWNRLREILASDPRLEGDAAVREHQMLFSRVTQATHFLSHAQHAISDMMINFGREPPRVLRAPPVSIPAMVQVEQRVTGRIPVNIGHRRTASAGRANAPSATATSASSATAPATPQRVAASASAAEPMEGVESSSTASSPSASAATSPSGPSSGRAGARRQTPPVGGTRTIEATVGGQPVVIGIGQFQFETDENGQVSMHGDASNMNMATGNDLLRTVMQAAQGVAAAAGQPPATTTTSSSAPAASSSSSTSAGTSSSTGSSPSGQDSHARGNTQTQPTTSTRTRASTQVQYAPMMPPLGIPLSGGMPFQGFDPFLRCESHHLAASGFGQQRRMRHPAGIPPARPRSASVPPQRGGRNAQQRPEAAGQQAGGAGTGTAPASPSGRPTVPGGRGGLPAGVHISMAGPPGPMDLNNLFGLANAHGHNVVHYEFAQPHHHHHHHHHGQRQQQQAGAQQQQQGGAANEALDPSLRGLLEQLLQGQQQSGAQDDGNVLNMLQGVLQQVMGAAMDGTTSTIGQFLDSLPDYNYVAGESLFTDLLHTLASNVTFTTMIDLVMNGGSANLDALRQPLRAFILDRVLSVPVGGAVPERVAIQRSVLTLADSLYPELEEMGGVVQARDDVDLPETLHNFLGVRLVDLIEAIVRDETTSGFSDTFLPLLRRVTSELVTLVRHSATDDVASLERLVENRLALVSEEVGPIVRQWTMSSSMGHLRNYVAAVEVAEEEVTQYVVTREAGQRRREERRRRREESESASQEDETFATPRSSPTPEMMETEEAEENTPVVTPSSSSSVPAPPPSEPKVSFTVPPPVDESQLSFPEGLLPRAGMGPDMVVGSQNWHRALPADWVPIIARDTSAVASDAAEDQAPFSDAYLSTQPAKRRKIAANGKPEGSVGQVVADAVADAISASGVTPSAGPGALERVASAVAEDAGVREAVREESEETLRRRLKRDSEFASGSKSGKFGAAKEFLEGKK